MYACMQGTAENSFADAVSHQLLKLLSYSVPYQAINQLTNQLTVPCHGP